MSSDLPPPDEDLAHEAVIVAMTVRNAMEDFHHDHLSDEQMAELNPIIRNAILTGLYAFRSFDPRCELFTTFQASLIPDYWEPPVLLPELTELRRPA